MAVKICMSKIIVLLKVQFRGFRRVLVRSPLSALAQVAMETRYFGHPCGAEHLCQLRCQLLGQCEQNDGIVRALETMSRRRRREQP